MTILFTNKNCFNMKRFLIPFLLLLAVVSTGRAGSFSPEKSGLESVVCATPLDLAAVNITEHSALLKWHEVSGALGYTLRLRVSGTSVWQEFQVLPNDPNSPPPTQFLAQNLLANTNYQWQVQSYCGGTNIGDWSDIKNFKTLGGSASCDHPTNLTATQITSTSAFLSWTASAGASAYELQYRKDGTLDWVSVMISGTPGAPLPTSFHLQNLMPDTWYIWKVRAICTNGLASDFTDSKEFKTLPVNGLCLKPENLTVVDITQTSAILKWAAVAGALGYQVEWKVCGTTDWQSATTTTNKLTVNNLTPGTCYIWHVRAKCDGSIYSDWSVEEDFHTLAGTVCVHPVDLSTHTITQNSALLKWGAVPGALGYEVQWKKCDAGDWQSALVNTNQFTAGNLAPATCYLWRVRTKCDGNIFSGWSVEIEFHTLANLGCTKPVDLVTFAITQTSAKMKWNAVGGALGGYEIQWKKCDALDWNSATVTTNQFQVDNLMPGTCYVWRVRAICDPATVSDWSVVVEFHTLGGTSNCVAPHTLEEFDITHHSAILKWNAVGGALGYEIRLRKVGSTDWSIYSSNVNKLLVDNLMSESDYEWQVRTKCAFSAGAVNYSDWSDSSYFSTLPEPPPPAPCDVPENLDVDSISHFAAKFIWDDNGNAFSYELRVRQVGTSAWQVIAVNGNPLPDFKWVFNLKPDTEYEAQIRAKCGPNNWSDWSDLIEFQTAEAPVCGTPDDLNAVDITHFSAKLTWEAVPGAVSYRVRYRKVGTAVWKIKIINGNPPATETVAVPLAPNSLHEWQVKAFCGPGSEGPWSPISTFMTLVAPPCEVPTGLAVVVNSPASATFSWNATGSAVSYKVRYRKINAAGSPGGWKIKTITGNPPATTTTINNLTPNSNYEAQVKAFCGPGSESAWSPSVLFTMPPQLIGDNPSGLFGNKNWMGNLAVFPNPASERMTFQFESSLETGAELRVFDLAGRTVFSTQLAVNEGLNEFSLPVSQLTSGLYVAQLRGTELVLTTKIRVER